MRPVISETLALADVGDEVWIFCLLRETGEDDMFLLRRLPGKSDDQVNNDYDIFNYLERRRSRFVALLAASKRQGIGMKIMDGVARAKQNRILSEVGGGGGAFSSRCMNSYVCTHLIG